MSKITFHPFDPITVPLQGSNLIEASAGTGKTYSIAIIALRLILEKDISIREILMVTFTKAAVAELEERIRKFIRSGYKCAQGEEISDKTISGLVQRSISEIGQENTVERLKVATLFLDETSVLTIHSFCQQTLTEFAFETNQLFGADLLQDTSAILQEEVQKFWRRYITTIPQELLSILIGSKLSQSSILKVVKQHLAGKRYFKYDAKKEYSFCEEDHTNFMESIRKINSKEEELNKALLEFVTTNKEYLIQRAGSNFFVTKNNVAELLETPDDFIDFLFQKGHLVNVKKAFDETGILVKCTECNSIKDEVKEIINEIFNHIYCVAINEISKGVEQHKLSANQLSFDDLIVNLHRALFSGKDNSALVSALQKKYKAVFIDEFQDTDKLQYEIFRAAFGSNTILFYIGDPKQSIYAWRKADIFTYFKAYQDVDTIYEMNVNYRSTKDMIDAMNVFFLPTENFDTFYFENQDNKIVYKKVESPKDNQTGNFLLGEESVIPITIIKRRNKSMINQEVAATVIDLLRNTEYKINGQNIRPSDIGILVRSKSEGFSIKNALARFHIPAVTVTDAKVLQSAEAQEVMYVLEAMLDHSNKKTNRALLTSFTGYKTADILNLNTDKVIAMFKNYRNIWEKNGVYEPMNLFISEFGVQKHLLQTNTENGERIITNLYQIIELLFKTESIKNLSPAELIDWLKRSMEEYDAVGDELEQRIENDEEAVKITTIHSSKGLQYPIVLAPSLDLFKTNKYEESSYRDEETSEYVSALTKQMDEKQKEMHSRQLEQENRRLVYVTITRAIYKCFIFKNEHYKDSSLSTFMGVIPSSPLISIEDPQIETENYYYNSPDSFTKNKKNKTVTFDLLQNNWQRMSYTRLAAELEIRPKIRAAANKDSYEQFIFSQLTRGSITGNMLHYIFENIHFSDDSKWPLVIEKAIKRFAPGSKEIYEEHLPKMIQQVLNVTIQTGKEEFRLNEIAYDQRIHEMEFDFPVSVFNPMELTKFVENNSLINVKSFQEIEGIMNGLIDLFFEHNGKYYILDWKSNYLGGTIEDYSIEYLADAMNENNYHLQYLIYTVAVKKYLESRLPGFDYERDFGGVLYIFIRGMREDRTEGVFYAKPPLEMIERLEGMFLGTEMGTDYST
ncbi:MAG: UvrD-helicase domain-containing protein [Ginsengibacter sp.]